MDSFTSLDLYTALGYRERKKDFMIIIIIIIMDICNAPCLSHTL